MPPERQSFINRPFVAAAAVLAGALVLGAVILAYTLVSLRSLDDTITSTGSAKESVTADSGKWTVFVSRLVMEGAIPQGYATVARDVEAVKKYVTDTGIEAEITTEPVMLQEQYQNDSNAPRRYSVGQTLTVTTKDVNKLSALAQNAGVLIERGIMANPYSPQYFISNLPELRVSLLGKAVEDSKRRAGELAKAGGATVGNLKSASSGVVQVMPPNSIDVSDYGSYDTSTIEKEVMITVRATFSIR